MQLSLSMSNVLHQALGTTINVIYQPVGNVFDHLLFLSTANYKCNFYILDQQPIQYHTDNSIVLPQQHMGWYSYNLLMTNNLLSNIENNINRAMHVNSLIMIHNDKPAQIKKEDREIINKTLWSYNKIFFHTQYLESWQLQNKSTVLNYGIPLENISYSTQCSNRTKDILIIGDEQNMINLSIKQAMAEKNYSCDITNLHRPSLNNIVETLNSYKIVIDLSNAGWINCLSAVAAGCYVIHNTQYQSNIQSAYRTNSIEDIIAKIDSLLSSYSSVDHLDRVQNDRLVLKAEYSFELFSTQINNIIQSLSQREVYIA
jgi:hypothetical protein